MSMHAQLGQLGMALMQIFQSGDAKQISKAKVVLQQARKSLYQILAESDGDDETEG